MATINQIALTISGNTGSIEFHTRQDGGIWATFDVAQTSRTQNPQTGQWEDGATTWIRCTASGYLAEHLQHSMLPTGPDGKQKGVPVIVTGSYVQREYTNQQGAKRSILELRATDLAVSLRAGTVAYNKADSPELARKGGEGIGRFQSQLADFTEPLAETIPGFHNIRHRFAAGCHYLYQ